MTVCGLLLQLKQKWGSTSISRHLKLRSLFYIHIYLLSPSSPLRLCLLVYLSPDMNWSI